MTEPRRETVPAALAGQRLDRVVALVADVSRREAADLLEAGGVTLDGEVVRRPATRVEEGTEVAVTVEPPAEDPGLVAEPAVAVPIVAVDDAFLVVDKPPGLVVHPGAGQGTGTMAAGLLAAYPELADVGDPERPGIVHRLDRDTSGLLVVARTDDAYHDLVGQLQRRSVERRYTALVVGHPDAPAGLVDAPIGRSPRQPTLMAVRREGKPARTRYEVEGTFDEPDRVARVACRLETGRTHQIRVHMKAIGHPVVGDVRYGGGRTRVECPRPFLHAAHLAFDHPVTGERVSFDSPLPDDLVAVLAELS